MRGGGILFRSLLTVLVEEPVYKPFRKGIERRKDPEAHIIKSRPFDQDFHH